MKPCPSTTSAALGRTRTPPATQRAVSWLRSTPMLRPSFLGPGRQTRPCELSRGSSEATRYAKPHDTPAIPPEREDLRRREAKSLTTPYFGRAEALHPLYSVPVLGSSDHGTGAAERPEGPSSMAFMTEPERAFARVLSDLFVANPFLPDWVSLQRKALGRDFVTAPPVWHA